MANNLPKTVDIYFDGMKQTCKVELDRNNEILCTAEDGQFVKFPAGTDLSEAIPEHDEQNNYGVEIIPDVQYGRVTTFDSEGKPINQ